MIAVLALGAPSLSAATDADPTTRPRQRLVPGPLCGVYCIYAAARAAGHDVEPKQLFKDAYVGHITGSSLNELCRAAADIGLYAAPVKNMRPADLRELKHPAILHVRANLQPLFNHFVVYLGDVKGRAAILDPASGMQLVDYRQLPATWGGTALVVSDSPVKGSWGLFTSYTTAMGLGLVGVLAGAVVLSLLLRRCNMGRSRRYVSQVLLVLLISSVACLVQNLADDCGLLRNGETVRLVAITRIHAFLREVGPSEVAALIEKGAVVVDARWRADFDAGHIAGALNVPPTMGPEDRRRALSGLGADASILLYCQSRNCHFAERVAQGLFADGYRNLSILKGGWAEWQSRAGHSPAKGANRAER